MAIFGFIVLCVLVIIFTFAILFTIRHGGEEFSSTGIIPSTIGLLFIATIWYGLFLLAPFKMIMQ